MGYLFLACGLLFLLVHILASLPFLLLAGIFLYYAPRWDLRIELGEHSLWFSENVLDQKPVEIALADLAEIRRVAEESGRANLLTGIPDRMDFVEFVAHSGKVWRMHDIFSEELDRALIEAAGLAGVQVKDLEN